MENINNFQGMLECFFIFGIFFVLLLLDWLYVHGTKRKTVFVVKEKGTLTHGRVSDGNGVLQNYRHKLKWEKICC